MTLIGLRAVEKFYGGRPVLRDLEMKVGPGARMGLVGPNGAGKSTLLRVLAGIEEVHSGEVTRRKNLRAVYLPQQAEGDGRTPLETLRAARPELATVAEELEACEARLGTPDVAANLRRMQRLLERHGRLLERFAELGGRGFEGEARSLLAGMGFEDADMNRPTSELSGGQRKLVALGACLARKPDVLLLDEPEAHLDADRRERLEGLIRSFGGAVVIASHDRYLLDETVREIAELKDGRVTMWPGNYSAYALAREISLARQRQLYVTQQKEIARLEEAIRRFKQWAGIVANERHIKQARNKQRQIDRMEKIKRPVLERRKIGLDLRASARGGQKVLEMRDARMTFGDDPVFIGADLTVTRGERIGVVGPNGAGKSVLMKAMTGSLSLSEGEVWKGPSVEVGYLAQEQEPLKPEATPLDLVRNARPLYEDEAVKALGRFLFRYEQVRQPVKTLSGGERTRLGLLLLMLTEPNCLILDEPTNHLDIDSLEVLEAELERFPGTVVFVSHDRYFLDRIADRIIEVRDGELHSYEGGYSAWKEESESLLSANSTNL